MARKRPRRPRPHTPPQNRLSRGNHVVRTLLALTLLVGVGATLLWLLSRAGTTQLDDARRLEGAVRQALARAGAKRATLTWEGLQEGRRTLVIHVPHQEGLSLRRLHLELEAALHNLGGELEALPLLERGGYGRGAFRGRLGEVQLRLVVLGEPPASSEKNQPRGARTASARLAIVLDDAGYSEGVVELVSRLPLQVAVAVLPNAPAAAQVAQELRAQGRELLLHMPMEPEGNGGPGPGEHALEVGLDPAEVRQRLERALSVVGPVAGVNNHMGSRATSDPRLMAAFMEALKGRGLYFLDSRTTPASVAERAARNAGIRALRRDVFLDVVEDEGAVRSALAAAASLARTKGQAVAIGHVHPLTVRLLEAELPRLGDVRLVRPSELL